MSKAKLKRELKDFSHEQLMDLILQTYDSSKDAKDFLEFFVNPDVEKLREKFQKEIFREMWRGKRKSTARISHISRLIKSFRTYGVDSMEVLNLMFFTFQTFMEMERTKYTPMTIYDRMTKLVLDMLHTAEDCGVFYETIERMQKLLESSKGRTYSIDISYRSENITAEIHLGRKRQTDHV